MRYAVISDIHANLEAFEAVLGAIRKENIDKYLFLGDVIGYGADPSACIKLLKSLNAEALIAGNHEWGALGKFDVSYFNDAARAAIEWTAKKLNASELDYLKGFKLTHQAARFSLVHGSLYSPEEFNYILNDHDAYQNMRLMKTPVCFVGHSHVAGTFYSEARVQYTTEDVRFEDGKKYVVNAGSIGQPRDSDPKASYVIYDEAEGTAQIRRTPYDIHKAQEKILKAGLPPILAYRLSQGR